ncbi:MAG: hypothetical protein R2712_27670 [Vicinamibacterales bacterium]
MAELVSPLDWETATAAGLGVEPGDVDAVLLQLNPEEQEELSRWCEASWPARSPSRMSTRTSHPDRRLCRSAGRTGRSAVPAGGAASLASRAVGRPGAAKIQRLFDAMLVADAQQALNLTDEQFPAFLTRLRTLQEVRRTSQTQRLRLMADLQRLSNPRNPPADEGCSRRSSRRSEAGVAERGRTAAGLQRHRRGARRPPAGAVSRAGGAVGTP